MIVIGMLAKQCTLVVMKNTKNETPSKGKRFHDYVNATEDLKNTRFKLAEMNEHFCCSAATSLNSVEPTIFDLI